MANFAKIFLAKAEERGTVEFGIAPNVVVGVRMERLAVLVAPLFLSLVLGLDIDRTRIPIGLLPGNIVAPFQDEDAFPGGSERVHQCSAARSGSDNNYVVVLVLAIVLASTANDSNRTYSAIDKVCG